MRNTLFFFFAFLFNLSIVAMDPLLASTVYVKPSGWSRLGSLVPAWPVSQTAPSKPVSGGKLMASLRSEDDLFRVVSLDTYGASLNVSDELNKDMVVFLRHISGRVEEIRKEIVAHKDSRSDSFDQVAASIWSYASSKLRAVQTTLKNPASENMAQTLIKKIQEANEIRRNNPACEWQIDTETQELVTTVQSNISELMNRYGNEEFVFIKTQMEYLVEYQERIYRVNELMGESLN